MCFLSLIGPSSCHLRSTSFSRVSIAVWNLEREEGGSGGGEVEVEVEVEKVEEKKEVEVRP